MGLFKSKDEKLAEALQESILDNLQRTGNVVENLSVTCADGIVSLSGMCDTPNTRKKAILFAEMAEGVTDVQSGELAVTETAEDATPPESPASPEIQAEAAPESREVAAPIAADAPKSESRFYTIKSGDSLSKIAKEFYGDANKYMLIFEANKGLLKDPNKIYPGREIRIPPVK